MRISSWAAMTKRHRGRQWHCRTGRTFRLDYASPPQATQWPDGRSKHIGQWLGCGNSIPRYVFPLLKTCCLIGVLKTSRDTKKHCGKPGCPNDHRSQDFTRCLGRSGGGACGLYAYKTITPSQTCARHLIRSGPLPFLSLTHNTIARLLPGVTWSATILTLLRWVTLLLWFDGSIGCGRRHRRPATQLTRTFLCRPFVERTTQLARQAPRCRRLPRRRIPAAARPLTVY
jgi:hypothetical protein